MKNIFLSFLFALVSFSSPGQGSDPVSELRVPKHFISVNPANLLFWQQAGISYEFKPGRIGLAVSAGYMYANNWNISYYFIGGPIDYGALGYYSGFYAIPQLNIYAVTKVSGKKVWMLYASLRGVYRYMTVDSKNYIPWLNDFQREEGDYRKMDDVVNIRAAFINIGMKFVNHHLFMDINGGYGILDVYHDMTVYGSSYHPGPGGLYPVPLHDTYYNWHMAVNFNFNVGVVF